MAHIGTHRRNSAQLDGWYGCALWFACAFLAGALAMAAVVVAWAWPGRAI